MKELPRVSRRSVLKAGMVGAAGTALAACGAPRLQRIAIPQAGPVTVSYGTPGGAVEDAAWKPVFEAFNASHKNINAVYKPFGGNYTDASTTKLQTLIAGGTAPDIFWIPVPIVATYASQHTIVEIDKYVKSNKVDLSQVFPSHLNALRWKGKLWGLPRDGAPQGMYYNAELFDKARIPYPTANWTWDDLLSAAKELTHRDSNGRAVQLGVARGDWASFLWQAGGDILNKAQNKCVLDAAPAVKAFQFLQDLVVKHKVAPTNEDVGTTSSNAAGPIIQNMFSAGRIGMWFGVRGSLPQVCQGNFAFDVAPTPKEKQHAAVLSVGPTVLWSGSKNKEAAFELMSFFIGLEGQRLKMSNGFAFPCRKDALTQDWFDKYTCGKAKNFDVDNAFATELDKGWARSYPVNPKFQQIQTAITAQVDTLYIGQQPARQICKTMTEAVNGILGGGAG